MSAQLSPEQRTLRARVAAFAKHAKHDPAVDCATAREALWNRYRGQVDPANTLAPGERDRRARAAMKADLARRAFAAAGARRMAREQQADSELVDSLLGVS